jgi:hypothetical protein
MSFLEPVSRLLGRSFKAQLALVTMAVLLVVGGLLAGLPTKQIDAKGPTPYDPAAPTAIASDANTDVTVDAPYVLEFSKPMNQGSVARSLRIDPVVPVKLVWDSTGQTLSVTPVVHWKPFTKYAIEIGGAALDQSGMKLDGTVQASFKTGALTSGKIAATTMVGDLISPSSTFTLTFTRAVKLATVQARWSISPGLTGTITGDDPTDVSSQVFTLTPNDGLAGDTTYTLSFDSTDAADASGAALLPVASLSVTTMAAPQVLKFRPADKGATTDPNQVVSVRFSVQMDRASTGRALSVTVNGRRLKGAISWQEGDTVLVFDPTLSIARGSSVHVTIVSTARSAAGQRLSGAASATFTVRKPTAYRISWLGGKQANSPWFSSEKYYMGLMNCTRTGGWVTAGGACSSVTHHVMPAQGALRYNPGISTVARTYSKVLAERGMLTHYLDGTTPHQRMAAAGYPGGSWGENLASPSSVGASGMIHVETFFQNEYKCRNRCEFAHYYNIMNPYFHQAGVGVWVARGHVRVTIEFYG